MGIGKSLSRATATLATAKVAPEYASGFVRTVLDKAINGVGRYPGARAAAEKRLKEYGGDTERAIHQMIETHVRLAGAQGFVTNLGGLVTLSVTIPANVAGLALLQSHLVAAIVHLRGFDVDEPRVRNAILACMMGEDTVNDLVKGGQLPSTPLGIASAPVHDPDLDRLIAKVVTAELITRVGGKRMVTSIGRRIPLMGGFVGATVDGFNTWRVGRYAEREMIRRG
jgi:EcsC protein family